MESKLFYVAVQDNEWSLAVELIQKEPHTTTTSAASRPATTSGIWMA